MGDDTKGGIGWAPDYKSDRLAKAREILDEGRARGRTAGAEHVGAELDRLRRILEGIKAHREELRWVRQTVHQAHHEGEMDTCRQAVCVHLTKLLVAARPGQ